MLWRLPEVELPEPLILPEPELFIPPELPEVPMLPDWPEVELPLEPLVVPLPVEPGVVCACAAWASRPKPNKTAAIRNGLKMCFFMKREKRKIKNYWFALALAAVASTPLLPTVVLEQPVLVLLAAELPVSLPATAGC